MNTINAKLAKAAAAGLVGTMLAHAVENGDNPHPEQQGPQPPANEIRLIQSSTSNTSATVAILTINYGTTANALMSVHPST
jgi:hypothetical protein